jgi:hypothetical protein
MKNKKYSIASLFTVLGLMSLFTLSGCFKENEIVFRESLVEFHGATITARTAGRTYPILVRPEGAATSVPTFRRSTGTIRAQVNLVGAHRSAPLTIPIKIDAEGTTAVAGVHYTAPNSVTIPANSSFGFVEITVLSPPPSAGSVDIVLTLEGVEDVKPSENYKSIGFRIAQNL